MPIFDTSLISAAAVLRSRFAPMPLGLHIAFCVFATVVFGLIFIRKKTVSSLIWMLICDTTAVLQFFNDPMTATAVAVCEIFLFALLAVVSIREKKAEKAKKLAEENADEEPEQQFPDDLNDLDRLIKSEKSKLSDNSNDVIHNAFEDDRR